jgi:predicted AAA+ superfamily ATPase
MNDFEILTTDNEKYNILIIMKTYEAPLNYLDEIAKKLRELQFRGVVLIDELMHSGNNNDRFIKGFFDGENFDKNAFSFEMVDRRNEIRKYSCDLLRKDPEIFDFSGLNEAQKKLINKGLYI